MFPSEHYNITASSVLCPAAIRAYRQLESNIVTDIAHAQSLSKPLVDRTPFLANSIMQPELSRLLTPSTLIVAALLTATILSSSVPCVTSIEFDSQFGASLPAAFPRDEDHRISRGQMTSRSNRIHLYVSHWSMYETRLTNRSSCTNHNTAPNFTVPNSIGPAANRLRSTRSSIRTMPPISGRCRCPSVCTRSRCVSQRSTGSRSTWRWTFTRRPNTRWTPNFWPCSTLSLAVRRKQNQRCIIRDADYGGCGWKVALI